MQIGVLIYLLSANICSPQKQMRINQFCNSLMDQNQNGGNQKRENKLIPIFPSAFCDNTHGQPMKDIKPKYMLTQKLQKWIINADLHHQTNNECH